MLRPMLLVALAVLGLLVTHTPFARAHVPPLRSPAAHGHAGAHADQENHVWTDGEVKIGGKSVPWAHQYATHAHLNSLPAHATEAHWVGEMRHDRHRHRALHEDMSLPLPLHIHSLGHNRHAHPAHVTNHDKGRHRHASAAQAQEAKRRALGGTVLPPLLTPLYQGYGTHFSYIYIGSPPQRQSVIVDTGSHYTAFPCVGCQLCGTHTDNYWDPKNSSTVEVQKCNNGGDTCTFGQSYSEGSSWRAYKVVDKLWVGGIGKETVPTGNKYSIDFMFGCQTSETGLFRTQLADGIMGMAMAVDTLPGQLVEQKVATSNIFAMCFRVGGGIMTLGGVDQRIHS